MLGYFIWNSFAVLALQQPVNLASGGTLWMSSKDFAHVQSLPGQVTLDPQRLGQFFVSGAKFSRGNIRGASLGDPAKVLVTTPANYAALHKCPHWKDLSIENGEIEVRARTRAEIPLSCGFDRLSLPPEISHDLADDFEKAEKKLRAHAYSIGLGRWLQGRRLLVVYSALDPSSFEKLLPPALLPFYDFEFHSQISPGKNMIFELTLFEFSRDRASSLGVKWPKNISVLALDQQGKPHLHFANDPYREGGEILLTTDFGESQGVGKVLARPTLRTKPGTESRFVSGGEFPIRNNNAFQAETIWKSYGLKLSLTPGDDVEIGDREVSVDFKMEFSEPNPDMQVDGIPGIIQRQLESRFDLRMDALTILTTMVTLRENKAREGLYFLSQIPILSWLAGERVDRNNDSELWFALRPSWDEIPLESARDKRVTLEDHL